MQDSLPAGGLRLCREGVEPSGSLRKVSGSTFHSPFQDFSCRKVRLCQATLCRTRGVAGISVALHHRVAISNSRLIALDEAGVTFLSRTTAAAGTSATGP